MLDINQLKKGQILNLIEYMILVVVNTKSTDDLDSPDYLLEKFTKHFGTNLQPVEVPSSFEREYWKYSAKWGVSFDPMVRNVFFFTCALRENQYSFRRILFLFNMFFTGAPSAHHYRSVHDKTRFELLAPLIANDTLVCRLLTLAELED